MSAITAKASRKMKKYAVLTREPRCFLGSFDFSWEQRKVGDLLIERNQQAPMSDEYPLMAFIANEGVAPKGERYDRSALVTDTVNKLYKKTEKGDFIYSSNNLETGSIGLNKYGKACISPVYSIFEPTGIADSDFLGRRLVRKDFINAMVKWRQGVIYGQWRIHESDFLKIEITVPSVKEQRKIGTYLDQLDHLITLHQRKCANLCSPSQVVFSLLFATSTFSWEQRKLGDIADIVGGGTPSTGNQSYWDGDIDWYAPAEIADQIYANSSQKKITGLGYENSSAKMLPPGTVLFTSRAGIGKTAILTRKGCTNQGFQSIVPHRGELDSYFIFSRTGELKRYGELVGAGSTFVEVSGKQMAVMELMMPPTMREQQTIGGFFQQLDHLITLHQRECISFTGRADRLILTANKKRTTSSWEQRKLGEIGSVSMCRRIFKEQTSETGDIPFYKIGTFGAEPDAFISRELFEEYKSKYPYPKKGDILISASGSIGRTVDFAGNNEYFQDSNIVWLSHDERLSNSFLKCFYSVVKWVGIEGSTIKRLYNDNILNTVICMPSVPEQEHIGLFFENLDNLITLHQRKPFLMKWRTSDANRNQTNRLVL